MLKRHTGITILSLIITVIILLILTGIAIKAFNDGLIGKTENVVDQKQINAKKSEIEVSIAKRVVQTSRGLDIEDLFEQLAKDEIIQKENSNKENGRVKIEPEGYVYEIKKKSNGDWEVVYIGKEDIGQEELEIQISQNTTGLAPKVILTMVAKAQSGIKSYTPPTGSIETYSAGTKEITETYEVTKNGTYTFTVTNNNNITKSKSITINNILEDDITYVVEPSTPTKGNVKVTITWPSGDNKGIQEIKIGNKAWEVKTGTTTEITVTENTVIKARVKNTFNEVIAKTITIDNIDRIAPSAPTIAGGSTEWGASRTISVSKDAVDNADGSKGSGVAYYEYYVTQSSTEPTISTSGISLDSGVKSKVFDTNSSGSYVYFRAIDKVGNVGQWSNSQRIYIDVNSPIVTANSEKVTIKQGDTNDIATYFTVEQNGSASIVEIKYEITSNNNQAVTNTNTLAEGTHTIKCTATKANGLSGSDVIEIVVERAGPPSISSATDFQDKTTEYEDEKGNTIWVPEGFKVRTDYATTVQNGIVIEDIEGSQFVWVPIGEVTKDDGTKVTIELGRYDFDDMIYRGAKEPTLMQSAKNFKEGSFEELANDTTHPSSYEHYESDYFEYDRDYFYTTYNSYPSQFLEPWINNTLEMGGYYIARWEARLDSKNDSTYWDGKDYDRDSYPSLVYEKSRTSFQEPPLNSDGNPNWTEKGELWVNLPQWAAMAGSNHRAYLSKDGNSSWDYLAFCDLVNSYAWDTALVFIQKCSGDSTYGTVVHVNDNGKSWGIDFMGTDYLDDVRCNIYNMNSNLTEWTTEYKLSWYIDNSKPTGYRFETTNCLRGEDLGYGDGYNVVAGMRSGGIDYDFGSLQELGFRSILIVDYKYEGIHAMHNWFFDGVDEYYAITR